MSSRPDETTASAAPRARRPRLELARALGVVACVLAAGTGALGETGEAPAPKATLEIEITNVASDVGTIVVALAESAAQFDAGDRFFRSDSKVPIRGRRAEVRFEGVPFGDYAVKVFHDENRNGRLDTNLVGFPKEGFGFSNDAMGRFGPPSFDQAAFQIASARHRIRIRMR